MSVEANRRLIIDPDALGTSLIILVLDLFGPEVFDWEPEVIDDELKAYAGAPVPQANLDTIQAIATLLESDRFFNDPRTFNYVANALSKDGPVLFTVFDPATPEEMSWAVSEAIIHSPLGPEETMETRFSTDVQQFIAAVLLSDGFVSAPPPLDFVKIERPESEVSITRDDPIMFESMWRLQQTNREVIGDYVRERISRLRDQLASLSLNHGDIDKVTERLTAVLS